MKELKFEKKGFFKRISTMFEVDFRRMFTTPLFYIFLASAFMIPVLILVMTSSFGDATTIDPVTGVEKEMEMFTNVWQIIGSTLSYQSGAGMSMDMTTMCNINLLFFIAPILICINISEDFRSGYAKNLFTYRAKKVDYVISKILLGFICATYMLVVFFIGAMIGGAISKLPFDLGSATAISVLMCMLSKAFLMLVFISIVVVMSVIAKEKLWMSILLFMATGMLLFMMIPSLTPLDATIVNVVLCLVGGVLFSIGLGAVSNTLLTKRNIL